MKSFFFRELQLITVLLLICNSYTSWSTWFISLKLCLVFFIFDSVYFLLKFIFLLYIWTLWLQNVIIRFEIKIAEKTHTSFAPRPQIFKLQQEDWKFSELELPKNWPRDAPFKLRKSTFWVRHFFSVGTFK